MNKYWYDYMLEDERKYEDNKATTYDTDCLNELISWNTNKSGFNVV